MQPYSLDSWGYTPVMKLFLDRENTGTFVDAIINGTPEAANLSIFGVFAYGWPLKIPW